MSQSRDDSRPTRPWTRRRPAGDARRPAMGWISAGRSAAIASAVALLALALSLVTDATARTARHADVSHRSHSASAQTSLAPHRSRSSSSSVKVDDHAHLSLRKAFGAVLLEEGSASGTLPGRTTVRLVVEKRVTASFTIHASGGSIVGTGGAALHSAGRFASFGGWLKVTHGTGRYANAHGTGKLYGVIDRRRHSLTVTTTGTLHY